MTETEAIIPEYSNDRIFANTSYCILSHTYFISDHKQFITFQAIVKNNIKLHSLFLSIFFLAQLEWF